MRLPSLPTMALLLVPVLFFSACTPTPAKVETPQAFAAIASSTPPPGIPAFALEKRPEVTRSRFATVNMAMFDRKAASAPDSSLRLNLFEDLALDMKMDSLVQNNDSIYSWYGTVDSNMINMVNLVVGQSNVYGFIQINATVFEILPFDKGIVQINEVDQTKFDAVDQVETLPDIGNTSIDPGYTPPSNIDPGCKILVLVSTVLQASTDNSLQEVAFENNINQAFNRYMPTGAMAKVKFADYAFVSSGNLDNDKAAVKADAMVKTLRDAEKADLVCMLIPQPAGTATGIADSPPIAELMNPGSFAIHQEKNFVSIVAVNAALSALTFAHETGHQFGMAHDRNSLNAQGRPGCNFGFVFPFDFVAGGNSFTTNLSTIMCIPRTACGGCGRWGVYSQPTKITGDGWSMGPMGRGCNSSSGSEPADNRSVLVTTFPYIRQYR